MPRDPSRANYYEELYRFIIELGYIVLLLILIVSVTVLAMTHDIRSADVTTLLGAISGGLVTGAGFRVASRRKSQTGVGSDT